MMNNVLRFLRRSSFLFVAMALACLALAPACRADAAAKAEKHARKIERKIARYRTGTFLEIDLRDNSQAEGSLRDLSDASFEITNADSNRVQTFNYADVDRVRKGREYIGAGSEPGHHFRLWVPVLIGAVAAGGGIAAYEAMH